MTCVLSVTVARGASSTSDMRLGYSVRRARWSPSSPIPATEGRSLPHRDTPAEARAREALQPAIRLGYLVPMARYGAPKAREPARSDVDAALAAMSAEELRDVVQGMLRELDDRAFNRVASSLVSRAARNGSHWAPAALSDHEIAQTLAFAEAAERIGQAGPSEMDQALRRGSAAFLGKDYRAAHQILGALLRPIANGDVDLGQDEMVDEVLGTDTAECAAQYVVATYMISLPAERAPAVRAAIEQVQGVGYFWDPIKVMEGAAVEPLPDLEAFLRSWRDLLCEDPAAERDGRWESDQERWVREVVARLEGAGGLASLARSTRRAGDLRAWCESLVGARDWQAALPAFDEAAGLVTDSDHVRAELLDGAALAAQSLGRRDLPARLERAWRAGPTMARLRRWLGTAGGKAALRKCAAVALEACPKGAARQRAFLHLLRGDFEESAELLASAPGLGWSHGEHPGHLLFSLFARLLGAVAEVRHVPDFDELELMTPSANEPRLATPEAEELLRVAGIETPAANAARRSVVAAMRRAAERRLEGVTANKRRRHYGHAANLVALCLRCDRSPATQRWATGLDTQYRQFSALRRELGRALGTP